MCAGIYEWNNTEIVLFPKSYKLYIYDWYIIYYTAGKQEFNNPNDFSIRLFQANIEG